MKAKLILGWVLFIAPIITGIVALIFKFGYEALIPFIAIWIVIGMMACGIHLITRNA